MEISCELPFWLKVDGRSPIRFREFSGSVEIITLKRDEPQIPGTSVAKNAYLIHDDTDFIAHTKIVLKLPGVLNEDEYIKLEFFDEVVKIVNFIINTARHSFSNFVLRQLTGPSELTNCKFRYSNQQGMANLLPGGGITNKPPEYPEEQRTQFGKMLIAGSELELSVQLMCDARHYLIKKNHLMSLANHALSFEVFLAEVIRKAHQHGVLKEKADVYEWGMGELSDKGVKSVFGGSLQNAHTWGDEHALTYKVLNEARNKVLHKGILKVCIDDKNYDFDKVDTLSKLLDETDQLKSLISQRLKGVLKKHFRESGG